MKKAYALCVMHLLVGATACTTRQNEKNQEVTKARLGGNQHGRLSYHGLLGRAVQH